MDKIKVNLMTRTNNYIFKGLHIIAWIIFIGLCIEAGGLFVNFFFSLFKPEVLDNLYQKLNLIELYVNSKWAFFGIYSFIISISFLKAYLFYIVIKLMHKMDLSNPFSPFISNQITKISYYTIAIGLLSYVARETATALLKHGIFSTNLSQFWVDSEAFIMMGAVIYIIATIFKKGVEIQSENQLTI